MTAAAVGAAVDTVSKLHQRHEENKDRKEQRKQDRKDRRDSAGPARTTSTHSSTAAPATKAKKKDHPLAKHVADKGKQKLKSVRDQNRIRSARRANTVRKETDRIRAQNIIVRRPTVTMFAAEYFIAFGCVMISLIWGKDAYTDKMRSYFLRITGISLTFFILGLTARSKSLGRLGIMFGGIIDVAMFFKMVADVQGQITVDKGGGFSTTPLADPADYQGTPPDTTSAMSKLAEEYQRGLESGGATSSSGSDDESGVANATPATFQPPVDPNLVVSA